MLPYGDFALRVPQHAIYLLPTILDFVMREPGRVSPRRPTGSVINPMGGSRSIELCMKYLEGQHCRLTSMVLTPESLGVSSRLSIAGVRGMCFAL